MSDSALTVRDLRVVLDGRPVLDGVDLDVPRGSVVALLGANGSGKSTLVRAAVGLLTASSGRIDVFGAPLAQLDRRLLGYVPQRSTAISSVPATVREVVMSGRLAHRRFVGWPRAADRDAVDRAVADVDLTDRLDTPVTQLSGGQYQRVLIARGLVNGPRLLVLDEPTAGIDHASAERLAAVVGRFVEDGGSVLVVEHELGELAPLITRIVTIDHGRIVNVATNDHTHRHPHDSAPPILDGPPQPGVI